LNENDVIYPVVIHLEYDAKNGHSVCYGPNVIFVTGT